jgi:hypothetical protein
VGGGKLPGKSKRRWKVNVKKKLKVIEREGMELINLSKLGKMFWWLKAGCEYFLP